MEKPDTYLLFFLGIILVILINYVKFYQKTRKLFDISGFLFFKYIFRIFTASVFLYIVYIENFAVPENQDLIQSKVYLINNEDLSSNESVRNFKAFVARDIKDNSNNRFNYSIGVVDRKKQLIYKIFPLLRPEQMITFLDNNSSNSLGFFAQKLNKNLTNFNKLNPLENKILILNRNNELMKDVDDSANGLFSFNSFKFIIDLKLYLLFLLILIVSLDISISLKIIKI
jgi:hypothetical protein